MPDTTAEPFDLTTHEVADLLHVSHSAVLAWANSGRLACWRTPGGHRRFRRSDVDALQPAQEEVAR